MTKFQPPKDASVQVALVHHIAGYGSGRNNKWVDCSCGGIYSGPTTEDAGAKWGRHYVTAAAVMWRAWSRPAGDRRPDDG